MSESFLIRLPKDLIQLLSAPIHLALGELFVVRLPRRIAASAVADQMAKQLRS